MRGRLIAVMMLCSCGHASVEKGTALAQKGLALADVGAEKLAQEYVQAVHKLRAYCAGDVACEKKYHVTDEDTRRVEMLAAKVGASYDVSAEALQLLGESWGELAPLVSRAKAAAGAVK